MGRRRCFLEFCLEVERVVPCLASMSGVTGIGSAQASAIEGIRSGMERLDRSASQVARVGAGASNATVLEISDEARAAAGQGLGAGLEGAMVDSCVAKYQVAANVRSLRTADEMSRELSALLAR